MRTVSLAGDFLAPAAFVDDLSAALAGVPAESEAIAAAVSRFLDDTMVTDLREVRIVHGFGTGQLRKGIQAFLKQHPLVLKYAQAPENQGGGGATVVELKD